MRDFYKVLHPSPAPRFAAYRCCDFAIPRSSVQEHINDLARKVDSVVSGDLQWCGNGKYTFELGLNIRPHLAEFVLAHLIEPLYFEAAQVWEKNRLNRLHPHLPHERNCVCCQITAAAIYVAAHHRHENIIRGLWLK
jgi:hypothetical protein